MNQSMLPMSDEPEHDTDEPVVNQSMRPTSDEPEYDTDK